MTADAKRCEYPFLRDSETGDFADCPNPATEQHRVAGLTPPNVQHVCVNHAKAWRAIEVQVACKRALLDGVRAWARREIDDRTLRELANDDVQATVIRQRLEPGWREEP